ncbi:MAG: NAD-dependent protein deacylase [Propionibacteriaceae bacterium]|jgi:NAD-dependent deacetylase|nr:NAD-dependent protein deacylase [Propionibacteriaceae bacterium]
MTEQLQEIIEQSKRIVFFGGAGVSTESGIPDFRSAGGLFMAELGGEYRPEEIVSHSFFVRHTKEFYTYYKQHLIYPDAKPNSAHRALASLESQGKLTAVVTQNIDGLHQDAGSKTVWELHGSVRRNDCTKCKRRYGLEIVLEADPIPYCPECGGLVKPDVVLYEEGLDYAVMDGATDAIAQADTLIVGGTSLVVYPAAGLVQYFRGKHLVLINLTPTGADRMATCIVREPIGEALSPFI